MNTSLLHLSNTKLILKLIKEHGQISRSELATQTQLTPPTITKIVEQLVATNKLVEYVGLGDSSGGRRPVVVRFKAESNFIIGIDLGATYIRGCLVDLNANFISEIQFPTEIDKGKDYIIQKIVQLIEKFQQKQDTNTKIWGVGIGVAGLVNKDTGIIESSPDFGWSNINLYNELSQQIDLPIFYDNSTRLMALGEMNFGGDNDLTNFAIINVGYGIAAGIVLNGQLIQGQNGFAGEFGHIQINANSNIQCKCGMYGCLEAMASGHRIAELGKLAAESGKSKRLYDSCNGNTDLINAETVYTAATNGDSTSEEIYNEITEYLAQGIGTLTNLLNPATIFLGGGISMNGDYFFKLVQEKANKHLLKSNINIKIQTSTFGENATSIGAVSLVLDKILNLELR